MKKSAWLLLGCLAAVPVSEPASAEQGWVQVRQVVIRQQPEFFAKSVGSAKYGDALELASTKGDWVNVTLPGGKGSGYVPLSALTKKQVLLTARQAVAVKADPSEVVLAGKGFSKELENEYKKNDAAARFDRVDAIEKTAVVSDQEVQVFAKQGGLVQ